MSVRDASEYDLSDDQEETNEPFEPIGKILPARFIFFFDNSLKEEFEETYDKVA